MKGRTQADFLARYRTQFAGKELVEHASAPDGAIRSFYLREKDRQWGRMDSVYLLFTIEGIIIAGDLCPNDNQGCASPIGYDIRWFAGRLSPDYLCSKFLRPRWVPELGVVELKRRLLEHRRTGDLARATARDLFEEIRCTDPLDQSTAYRIHGDAGLSDFEDLGQGYPPRDAALLIAIQERFSACYMELTADDLLRKSA